MLHHFNRRKNKRGLCRKMRRFAFGLATALPLTCAATPLQTQPQKYPSATDLAPFTRATNYMSLHGYLRYQSTLSGSGSRSRLLADFEERPTAKGEQATIEAGGYGLSLKIDKQKYAPDEKVGLTVTLKNVSTEEVKPLFLSSKFDENYQVEVLLPYGTKAPLTLYGQQLSEGGSGPNVTSDLPPGMKFVQSLDLNRLFDMTLTGTYKVSVTKRVKRSLEDVETTSTLSNSVQVVIKEEPARSSNKVHK